MPLSRALAEGIDATTPAGRLQLHVLGAIAEFERANIQERVRAGLARARAQGQKLGRPERTFPTSSLPPCGVCRCGRPHDVSVFRERPSSGRWPENPPNSPSNLLGKWATPTRRRATRIQVIADHPRSGYRPLQMPKPIAPVRGAGIVLEAFREAISPPAAILFIEVLRGMLCARPKRESRSIDFENPTLMHERTSGDRPPPPSLPVAAELALANSAGRTSSRIRWHRRLRIELRGANRSFGRIVVGAKRAAMAIRHAVLRRPQRANRVLMRCAT
jgi:Resolvase, N terminal domain